MNTVLTVVVIAFVFGVLALIAYTLFEISPFAHHADSFHGREPQRSPRLD